MLLILKAKSEQVRQNLKSFFLLFLIGFCLQPVVAQVGGNSGFYFMEIPTTAKVSALAGVNITSQDKDVNMFLSNPALLNSEVSKYASVNYLDYLGDIKYSSIAYAQEFEKTGVWAVGLQYLDYGTIEGFDEGGNEAADFNARDYAVTVSHSRTLGVFTMGANLKFGQSYLGPYTATLILADIGGIFKHPTSDFVAGLVFKNVGVVLNDYLEEGNTQLPFDIQVGASFKPVHMPFRFSITAYNLTEDNIAYYDASRGNVADEEPGLADKIFRHLAIGTEVLLSKNFNLRAGYNHLVRKELRLEETSGGAGFSAGFMFRIKAFEVAYSRRFYHVAGGSNNFTLASNLGMLIKKK